MELSNVKELRDLADEAGLLKEKKIQKLLYSLSLNEDKGIIKDLREYFYFNILGNMITPYPFNKVPKDKLIGDIEIGEVYDEPSSFGLLLNEMTQHILLAGRSGSGKTTLQYHMIKQLLEKNIPFWVFDFKREFRGLIQKSNDVIIFTPNNFNYSAAKTRTQVQEMFEKEWVSNGKSIHDENFGTEQNKVLEQYKELPLA